MASSSSEVDKVVKKAERGLLEHCRSTSWMQDPAPIPPPRRQQSPASPGAYAQGPTALWEGAPIVESPLGEDIMETYGDVEQIPAEVETSNVGLVSARLVSLPTEVAEPVLDGDGTFNQGQNDKVHLWILPLFLVGVAGFVLILTAVAVSSKNDTHISNTIPSSTGTNHSENQDYTATSDPWAWDLPFVVPGSTIDSIQEGFALAKENGTTPQLQAYEWIKSDPFISNYSEGRLLQRFALATFYYALQGPDWPYQGGGTTTVTMESGPLIREAWDVNITSETWLSYESSECTWFTFANAFEVENCRTPDNDTSKSELTFLGVQQNGLVGTLPPELALLTSLEYLTALERNQITGTIMTELGGLTNLRVLKLASNEWTGPIPSELGLLTQNLIELELINNKLSGQVPSALWNLSNLEVFNLGSNDLSGSIPPDFGYRLPHLQQFNIPRNQFEGTVPTSIGLMTDMVFLNLHENSFTGPLPSEIGQLVNLQKMFLKENFFISGLPTEIGLLSVLKNVNMEGNIGLTGTIPVDFVNLRRNGNLKSLWIRGTGFTGTISSELCGMKKLLKYDCSASLCGCEDCPCIVANHTNLLNSTV
ncbi:Leucine Rich Repeat [Seminavis robusta]|uniref:Leucine Rich Repeat n=1 Tax=Seminavis robusta TaxID=568900 RepID=A0A9N8DQC9_9STRA|nr:Leucine Rich Repeat [Seminavis robusta]|eukprot:Sro296_g110750.1 Leucine Rich Repeat (594) ;mRNA; r:65647-67428